MMIPLVSVLQWMLDHNVREKKIEIDDRHGPPFPLSSWNLSRHQVMLHA